MTHVHDDQARMAAYRQGDAQAGRELYRRYFGKIRRYFANKACQPADVEDLVHRTFEIMFAPTTKIAEAERFGAYLFGIAHNVWYGQLRERMRRTWVDVPGDDAEALERYLVDKAVSLRALGAGNTTIREYDERLRKLLDALRGLPLAQQEIVELHYWEEMTLEELAAVLGIPVGTAKSRLRLVKEKLVAQMEGPPPGDDPGIEQAIANMDAWARRIAVNIRRRIPD